MHVARSVKAAAAAVLSSMVAAIAIAGPLAGTALAAKPPASVAPNVTSNLPSLQTSSTSVTFSWTTTPATQESFSCFLDGIKSNCGSGTTGQKQYTGLAAGNHSFFVRAKQTGHFRAVQSANTISWTIDLTGPTAPVVTQPASPSNDQTPSVAFGDTDDASTILGYACVLGTTTPPVSPPTAPDGCTSPWSPTAPLGAGSQTLYVYAFDKAAPTPNRSAAGSTTWFVDLTAPGVPSLATMPAKLTNSTSASFSWTDEPGSTSSCSFDTSSFTSCGGAGQPRTKGFTSLSEGDHTFVVEDTDSANNTGAPASYSWHIDLTAPDAPVVNGPGTTDSTSASFSYSDSDKTASFLCQLDGVGGFAACQTSYGPLSDGSHELDVEAKDPAGNVSAATAYTWSIDTTVSGPVAMSPVQFIDAPDAFSNASSFTFTWLGLDDTTTGFLCALDSSTFTPCGAPDSSGDGSQLISVSAEGAHVFAVKATDGTNVSPATPWRWTYDKTPPAAPSFSSKPADPSNSTSAMFSFASEPNVTFTCSLDGATAQPCSTPTTLDNLSADNHTFAVTAFDGAGNSSTSSYSWLVDLSAPPAPVLSGTTGYVNVPTAHLSWTESGTGLTFTCFLNGQLHSCDNPTDLTDLADGQYTFAVSASNGSKSTAASRSWTVDTNKPVLSVGNVPAEGAVTNSTTTTPSISQPGEANAGAVTCGLTGPTPSSTCGPYIGLADGNYELTAHTTDLAGNVATAVVRHWTVDATAPAAPSVTGPAALVNTASSSFGFGDSDSDVTSYTCSLDGGAEAACQPSYSVADGAHALVAFAHDAAGNKSAGSAPYTWTVDTTPPAAPSVSGAASTTNTQPTFTFSDSESPVTFDCAVDGGSFSSCTSPYQVPSALTVGSHSLSVRANDGAGNTSAATAYLFNIASSAPGGGPVDSTPPTATIAAATTLTGGSTGTFSETVHSLTAGGAALVITGTSIVVPSNVVCLSGSTVVACGGNFTALRVTPKSALVSGQHYTVRLLAGSVQDTFGNPLAATSRNFRGARDVQETSPGVKTSWATGKSKAAYGGSFVRENTAGASATYTFTGTDVTWWTTTGPNQGKATVFIDGVKKAIVNNYAAAAHFKVARKYGKLSNKRHAIRIVVRGVKGAKAGGGTFVTIDAYSVGKKVANTPALVTGWASLAATQLSGGHAAVAKVKGDALTFTFRGTGISWLTERSRTQGKVAVYLDGVKKVVVDNYAAATKFGVKRTLTGLSDKVHTLRLVVLGTHHKGGTGTWVTVDRFLVT